MSSKSGGEVPTNGRTRRSLALRLTCWYAAMSFAVVLSVAGYSYWALIDNLDREDDQFLADRMQEVTRDLARGPEHLDELRARLAQTAAAPSGLPILVRVTSAWSDDSSSIIVGSPGSESIPRIESRSSAAIELESADGREWRVLSRIVRNETTSQAGWRVDIALDRTHEEAFLRRYQNQLWLVLAVALLVCVGGGLLIAWRELRPLREISSTARAISASTLDQRLNAEPLTRELAELATTFNGMLDRLEDSFSRLSQFSGDIAHELRTPISNLRGELEVALNRPRSDAEYRDVLGSCLEECGRLSQMVESLLFLARAEQPQALLHLDDLSVSSELETLRTFYEAAAEEVGVTLTTESPENLTLQADRALFQRALGNLLTNALTHTPRGGHVTLKATSHANSVVIEVIDTGCGIAPEHLPHVFNRLYRADTARTSRQGTGLGLAIVKSILELHSGSVTIKSPASQGTVVRTEWPRRQA
jgi:two-component system heavy metal sensor histidine kinase CusS